MDSQKYFAPLNGLKWKLSNSYCYLRFKILCQLVEIFHWNYMMYRALKTEWNIQLHDVLLLHYCINEEYSICAIFTPFPYFLETSYLGNIKSSHWKYFRDFLHLKFMHLQLKYKQLKFWECQNFIITYPFYRLVLSSAKKNKICIVLKFKKMQ